MGAWAAPPTWAHFSLLPSNVSPNILSCLRRSSKGQSKHPPFPCTFYKSFQVIQTPLSLFFGHSIAEGDPLQAKLKNLEGQVTQVTQLVNEFGRDVNKMFELSLRIGAKHIITPSRKLIFENKARSLLCMQPLEQWFTILLS
jgi:hypothetical protein